MTKKCTGQNPPGTASAKPGELWGGKGKRAPYSTWHYETNHKTRHALHQGKHYTRQESCPPDLSQNNSIPFTNVEIWVPGESGPPDALHSPRSTRCRGAVGLPFISPIIKPLDKEWAKPWMFCCQGRAVYLSLMHRGSHPHVHTAAEASATMCDRLCSTQRDSEVWHPLISCHTLKSRLNEVKSK